MKRVFGSKRRVVTRAGRRFSICGLPARRVVRPAAVRYGLGWATGATLVAVILYSAFAIGRPPAEAPGVQRPAIAGVARYSLDDYVNATR
jgi:hypothetical protein